MKRLYVVHFEALIDTFCADDITSADNTAGDVIVIEGGTASGREEGCEEDRGEDEGGACAVGRLNIHRAEMGALAQLLLPLLSATDLGDIKKFRRERPEGGLQELMGVLALGDKVAPLVRGLLTDSSRCFSLWVIRQNGIGSQTTVLTETRVKKANSRVVGRLSW